MKSFLFTLITIHCSINLFAQQENGWIRMGNKLYKEKQFEQSSQEYRKAVVKSPKHPLANYNMGNAQFRTNNMEDAVASYDASIANSKNKPVKEKGYYNKGVAFSKQQKLNESIDAWKNALKLDPNDQQARENLQKALMEQKQQQQQQQKQKEEQEKKDQKDQKQEQNKNQQPKQNQQSKLTKKQVEQLLKALQQKEREVQHKMQSKNASPNKQDKDW